MSIAMANKYANYNVYDKTFQTQNKLTNHMETFDKQCKIFSNLFVFFSPKMSKFHTFFNDLLYIFQKWSKSFLCVKLLTFIW